MPTEVSSPLQDIVKRLAATQVEGPAAQMKKRFMDASDTLAVVCDCSGSMSDLVGYLQIVLEDVQQGFPKIRLVAFASIVKEVTSARNLPDPTKGMGLGSSANLAGALEFVSRWKPRKTIVISDGLPDSESDALEAAAAMTGSIDTIYCGPDSHPAVEFLQRLARSTGGREVTWDGRYEICGVIRGLLPAPGATR